MICPRCTVAEISAETHTCVLCGYSPGGVTLEVGAREELDEAAHRELADQFEIEATLSEEPGPVLVYTARESGADRVVALRVSPRTSRDTRLEERFQRDMTAAAALDHPHIVPLYRFGTTKTLFWYAMKHVEGRTLTQVLLEKGRIDPPACLRLVEQVASALQYAHRRGTVHGDFRPANVLLDDDWALVTGFAAVRPHPEGAEPADARAAAHVAPETATLRQPGPASDQYALAATIHECLTGAPPAADQRSAASHPDIPANLWTALRRALDRDPAQRFPSVSEFISALSATEAERAPVGPAPSLPPELRSTQRVLLVDPYRSPRLRQRLLIGAAVVAGLFVLINLMRPAAGPPASPTVVLPGPLPTQPQATTAPPPGDPVQPSRTPVRASGTPTRPSAVPVAAELGLLFINATPWGEVFVDDQLVGTTPQAALPVAPGEHRIRVVREGYQPYERAVSVAPGQQIRLTNIVLEAEQP